MMGSREGVGCRRVQSPVNLTALIVWVIWADAVRSARRLNRLEDLTNDLFLVLWDANLAELARVDVSEEVVSTNFASMAFKQCFYDLEGSSVGNNDIVCLIDGPVMLV